jgi:adenine-specific DNA-methyltransferase
MLNRYIGKKTALLDRILEVTSSRAAPGALVCDIFSGTLAVSLAMKQEGYRVATNDINYLSAVYGRAFLLSSDVPAVSVNDLVPSRDRRDSRDEAVELLTGLHGSPGYRFVENGVRDRYLDLLSVLAFLGRQTTRGLPKRYRRSDFFDHYCEAGEKSHFVSSRGREGRRRFFTPDNARRLDAVLNRLRYWRVEGYCDETIMSVLLASLIDGIEKVSNTQGTYHDFPRTTYDARALKPLRLVPPAYDGLLGQRADHIMGVAEDSLEFIRKVPKHDVLYIDPPYNFRQYSAYYFLPNVIGRYPEYQDPGSYFGAVKYVRGQNPEHDFTSTFCSAPKFVDSLKALIARARTKTVILSYFDGRNHWNEFKAESNGRGYAMIAELFNSDLFAAGSCEVVPITRRNYQSYGGFKAKDVLEYLFIADKADL